MRSHPQVELRYRFSLLLAIRAAGAVRACHKRLSRMRRWARWSIPAAVVAALLGRNAVATGLIGLFFLVELPFWVGTIVLGALTWWGSRHAREEQRLELGAAGMRLSGPLVRSDVSWEAVTAVHDRRGFIVVLLRQGTGIAIPKRGRLDEVENADALAWLREREGWPSLQGNDPGDVPLKRMEEEILIGYQPSRRLVAAAHRQVTWRGPVGVEAVVFIGILWVLFGGQMLVAFIRRPSFATLPGAIVSLALAVVFGLALFGFIVFGSTWLRARRLVNQEPSNRGEQQVGISPSGIRTRGPVGTATLDWSGVRRSVETRRFFLMFISLLVALYIPKEACSEEQIAAIRALLGERSTLKLRRNRLDVHPHQTIGPGTDGTTSEV